MTWTTEKPTMPGWYWCRDKVSIWLVLVVNDGGELLARWVYGYDGNGSRYISQMNCDWAGPLEPPT